MSVVKVVGGYLEVEGVGLGQPSQPIYNPAHPDQGLPPSGGHPSQPIYNPAHPDQGLPGGTPVPPGTINPPLPSLPPALESQIVVAVHKPGQDWQVTSYPVGPSQGLPPQTPQPRR